MKCANCGAELTEDSRFCSYCGNKIEPPPRQEDVPPGSLDAPGYADQGLEKEQSMLMGKRLGEWRSTWGRLDAFSKIATIILIVFLLVLAGTLLSGAAAAVITAAIQIVLAVAAALIHNGAGKLEQKLPWFKCLLLVIAVTLIALPGAIYSWDAGRRESPTSAMGATVPATVAAPYGFDEYIGQDYMAIEAAFRMAGLIDIKAEEIGDLQAAEADLRNTIESISVGGEADFTKGRVFKPDEKVLIRYHSNAKCSVTIHVDFVPNLLLYKYDVTLLLNGEKEGTMTHGGDRDFELSLEPGEYTLTFESRDSFSVKGEVTLTVDCDTEASYQIFCYSRKVEVKTLYVDRLTEPAEG